MMVAMTNILVGAEPVHTIGTLPAVGVKLPAFTIADPELNDIDTSIFAGKTVVLNIFPSVDTDVCSMSVRKFNAIAQDLDNTVIVCVSEDLPFAQGRFCGAEGIKNVVVGSAFRSSFGKDFGVTMVDGPLKGLLSRSVVVANAAGVVTYIQQVPDVHDEPDYEAARKAVEALN